MTRRIAITLIVACTIALVQGSAVLAHDGHDHKVMGTVTMAAADHVMLTTTDGENVTIQVTKDTKVTKNKQTMKATDVQVGARVVVTTVSQKGETMAKSIQVGEVPNAAAK